MGDKLKEIADLKEKLAQAKNRYDALVEHAADGIYILDPDYRFTEVNTGMCLMLGYTREQLLGRKINEFLDPEQLKTNPIETAATAMHQAVVKERRYIKKDGSVLDVEINIRMYADERSLVIARDISARKKMEAELRLAELKFRTIAERSMVGIYIVQDSQLVYVNPRFAAIFGYQPKEMIDTLIAIDLFHDDYKEMVKEWVRSRLEGEIESVQYEAMCLRKDGSLIWAEFYGNRTLIGNVPSIIGSMIDITDRKKGEEILRMAEANWQTILNTTDTAYVLFDIDFRALAFNQTAAAFINTYHHHDPKVGDELMNYLPKERYARFKEIAKKALAGESTSYETNYLHVNGNVFYFIVRLFPLTDTHGKILGMVLALDDITERKNDEYRLRDAYDRIQTQLSLIKDVAWKQSHLIRSPLANLIGLVSLLQDDPNEAGVLEHIKTELGRLDRIIIDMAGDAAIST